MVETHHIDVVLAPAGPNQQLIIADSERVRWDRNRQAFAVVLGELAKVDLCDQLLVDVDRRCPVGDRTPSFANDFEIELKLGIRWDIVECEAALIVVAVPNIEAWLLAPKEVRVGRWQGRRPGRGYQKNTDDPE